MVRKKYRWNWQKCLRNFAMLALRLVAALLFVICMGLGPSPL